MTRAVREAPPGRVLVTGGTGNLGSLVVAAVEAAGGVPRIVSRRERGSGAAPGREWVRADLVRDDLRASVADVDAVVHLASEKGQGDADVVATERLLEAARTARVRHLVAISIVGSDRIPLPFYASKRAIEAAVRAGGVPWTLVRVAQFHSFVERLVSAVSALPIPAPIFADLRFQPVDEGEVAERLVEIAAGPPLGDAPDLAGPEVLTLADIAAAWLAATGRPATLVPVEVGTAIASSARTPPLEPWVAGVLDGYRDALNTPRGPSTRARVTFAEWLARRMGTPPP